MMSSVYVIVSTLPVVLLFVMARRARYAVGSANYAALLDLAQPVLTMLLAALLSVDAINREREEGSFPVVSLAPISAAGYLLRRWIGVMAMVLPVTLLPRIAGLALAATQQQRLPMFAAFADGWLLLVVPVLVMVSPLDTALGTINGNTTVAIITGAMLLTGGLEIANDIFAWWHLHFDGAAALMALDLRVLTEIRWSLAGFYVPLLPTEAAYPLAATIDGMLPRIALLFGLAAALLGMATLYLRRTRRDLRPWRARADHPLRSFIGVINRLRDAYSPDGSIGAAEWASAALGLVILGMTIAFIVGRARAFERLGAERYAAETQTEPLPMTADVVPVLAREWAMLSPDGHLRAHGELTLRNDGLNAVTHLGFALNPLVGIRALHASAGRLHLVRVWQRIGVDVDPPLTPGQSRRLSCALDGTPGDVSIPIPWSGGWRPERQRYVAATQSIDLTALSRSTIIRNVAETPVSPDAS